MELSKAHCGASFCVISVYPSFDHFTRIKSELLRFRKMTTVCSSSNGSAHSELSQPKVTGIE
ncbi:hypothetical protein M569_16920 [Genlisea aurea]|uniref:Uncharacterized protein n=1 Tax=Genlisea aurea TaxID=192259 RepID=S8DEW8_9LAMI|nr:hypothetical protein M569_16920 [Genlisea aurea]